jgi:hypothetical protein
MSNKKGLRFRSADYADFRRFCQISIRFLLINDSTILLTFKILVIIVYLTILGGFYEKTDITC